MKLRVWQHQEGREGRVRFVVNCSLELASQERQLYQLYGAIPLIVPPPPTPGHPAQSPALTPEQLKALMAPDGCTFESVDVRRALAFVEQLKAACRDLPAYWKAADQFNTRYHADPMEPSAI
jgi:hypothetical protein